MHEGVKSFRPVNFSQNKATQGVWFILPPLHNVVNNRVLINIFACSIINLYFCHVIFERPEDHKLSVRVRMTRHNKDIIKRR